MNTALAQPSFTVAATAMASELARAFHCEHVVVGMLAGSTIKLAAWSGVADLRQEFKLARLAAAAMNEAADQQSTLRYPPQADDSPRITLMHADLAGAGVGEAILTVPLISQQRIVGALSLLRADASAWQREEIMELENLALVVGPVLDIKQRSHESALTRAWRELRLFGASLTSSGSIKTKLITAIVTLGIAAGGMIPITVNITAPAKLEGVVQRSLSTPVDSFIKEVFVHPGDHVKSGQLLLTLADQDLLAEQRRLQSEVARYRGEQGDAFAQQDRAKMVSSQAQADEAQAQLDLVDQHLARTQVVAPFDAIVINGDLQQQIGAPVKRGDVLLVLSPSTDFRIVLAVEDKDIGNVHTNMPGKLTLSAMPYDPLNIRVERITPLAKYDGGRNVFEVQAKLTSNAQVNESGLRPGLEGVAKIALDRESIIQAAGGRVMEWLRFKLWSLFG
ncbi:MAG TPA: HlyD family efflux transporter periplasmic adaptor subunit [Rhodocyclaceae bacterium]|nr:HlyD family efflux transporter periplasmic adaptor subunit [Rhodocyclaceae bacterium]